MGKNKKIKLNENDLKNTLSAAKKVKPPKTVLVNNISDYWPVLKDDQIENFQQIFESFTKNDANKSIISIGLESTLRRIKNKTAKVLFLADEISPQWFGKHLIAMCLMKDPTTKIFIIPKLKEVTKTLLNIPSIICCLKEDVESISEFYNSLNIHEELLNIYCTIKPNSDPPNIKKKKKKLKEQKEMPQIVYLKKRLDSQPAFSTKSEAEKTEFDEGADFISLANFNVSEVHDQKKPLPVYRPLKVKKIIGNLHRKGIKDS